MITVNTCGRPGALRALNGQAVSPPPVTLFTWGFDYLWKVAGIEPWQLACGDHETWHRAHLALLERHQPDLIWYSGAGNPFILNTGSPIPSDVAPEAIDTMIRAAR